MECSITKLLARMPGSETPALWRKAAATLSDCQQKTVAEVAAIVNGADPKQFGLFVDLNSAVNAAIRAGRMVQEALVRARELEEGQAVTKA